MKKIITLSLVLIMALSLAACSFEFGGGDPTNSKPSGSSTTSPGENTSTPGQTESQTKQPSGNIDPKLIGEWNYEDISLHGSEHHNYFFYENGTASLFITGGMTYHGEVKFSTSGGKIYFTEYYMIDAIGNKELRIDKTVEYSIGTDERGEYLTIGNIPGLTEYGENRLNMKFRRV